MLSTKINLSKQLLKSILVIYFMLTVVVTLGHFYVEYKYTKSNISNELKDVAHTFESALKTALWDLDTKQLESISDGIINIPLIYGVIIKNSNDVEVIRRSKGSLSKSKIENSSLSYSFKINHKFYDKEIFLADVTIYSADSVVQDRVKFGFGIILFNALIKSTALLLLFFLAFRKHLEKPLRKLTAKIVDLEWENKRQRSINIEFKEENELSVLQDSFNHLLHRISVQEKEREELAIQLKNSLEQKIDTTTKELDETKKIYKTLFEKSSDGILVIKDNIFVECNSSAASMLGYENIESLLSVKPSEISPEFQDDGVSSNDKAQKYIEKTLKNGSNRFEWIHLKADGSKIWIEVVLTKIVVANDIMIHTVWRDINSKKELEKNIMLEKEKAQEATKAKSEFLANMSHEIRTPMNGIIGMSHLALQTELNDKQKNYLLKIDNSAKSLLGIINDILDFSKIEAGKLAIEKVEFDLFKVIDSVIGLVEFKAHEKNLELIVSYGQEVGRRFFGDPLRIAQILTNLMGNAVKFTSDGEVALYIHKISNDIYRFEVKDTGIGLTQEQQDRLFESFSQGDGTMSRKYGGTGLGLTISKQLVELMDGKIWVESKENIGSDFIFEIELESFEETQKQYQGFSDKKVLIVDDNHSWHEILSNLLQSFDIQVESAMNGKEAVEMMSNCNQKYDLILMDWNMPHLDGIETTKIIKESCKLQSPPTIIMVSSFRQESIVKLAKDVGIDIFLQKPINPSILNDILSGIFLDDIKINYTNNFHESSLKYDINTLDGSKILLVEDNPINQEIIVGLLENSGIKIDIANNGVEGIERYKTEKYELILMDLQMPVMDGYKATTIIRDLDKDIPIIALTANAMKEDVERTKAIGMDEHLNKPIDVEILYETLLRYICKKVENKDVKSNEQDNIDLPEFKYIDSEIGLKHLAGNKKLYMKILKDFYADYKNLKLEDLKDEDLKRKIHTLKGLSANIGAKELYNITKEIDETKNKFLYNKLYSKLKLVLDELQIISFEKANQQIVKEIISATKRDELFLKLSDVVKTKMPKKCQPIIDELDRYQLSSKDSELFEEVKKLIKKYKFKEVILMMGEV